MFWELPIFLKQMFQIYPPALREFGVTFTAIFQRAHKFFEDKTKENFPRPLLSHQLPISILLHL